MNADLLTLLGKILLAAITLFGSALGYAWGYIKLRDKRIRSEAGLGDNPSSCKDHEDRLRKIETVATRLDEKVSRIERDVDEIRRSLS